MIAVARLLASLRRQEISSLASFPLRQFVDPERRLTDEELLVYLLTRNGTHMGTNIRVDLGQPYSVGEIGYQYPRRSGATVQSG